MFIIVLGQHVSILTESSSDHSKKINPYLKCLKMRCGIPNAYKMNFVHGYIKNVSVWDPTAHFKHFK